MPNRANPATLPVTAPLRALIFKIAARSLPLHRIPASDAANHPRKQKKSPNEPSNSLKTNESALGPIPTTRAGACTARCAPARAPKTKKIAFEPNNQLKTNTRSSDRTREPEARHPRNAPQRPTPSARQTVVIYRALIATLEVCPANLSGAPR